ncbi:MAG: 2-hydroxychromene-2-carboxylate isomerase [Alphaproteobacteria bacterium]|nr:2-hydroxychromene-2-carboxylate isomerase [Alphaproteobacteria bacterium]
MTKQVEFYYDFGSPTAYLAWTQLPALCARHGTELVSRPVLLGGIFKTTGNDTPVRIAEKKAWMFDDMARYAARYGVPFNPNPLFIFNTLGLMRGAIWAAAAGCLETYNQAMFEACWVDGRNVEDATEIGAILGDAGLDAVALGDATQRPEIKTALIEATAAAVDRGVFGVPTMFVGDEMHFGQDRLDWVERALEAEAA